MPRFKLLLTLSLLLFVSFIYGQESKQKLYRIYPTDIKQIQNIEAKGINVFNSLVDNYIDVVASPSQIEGLGFEEGSIEFLANNFKELLDMRLKTGSYEDYHDHQETMDLLNEFATTYPEITILDTIGFSRLGREICSIKISDNPDEDEDETPILMVGCHHGNEVLSVEATLYQIDFLLNNI